uniref:Uncharacterized protein n=1 Tax=Glossina brevipalpis TaxID=37001 RepID=A0A1A9WH19_9MUSC
MFSRNCEILACTSSPDGKFYALESTIFHGHWKVTACAAPKYRKEISTKFGTISFVTIYLGTSSVSDGCKKTCTGCLRCREANQLNISEPTKEALTVEVVKFTELLYVVVAVELLQFSLVRLWYFGVYLVHFSTPGNCSIRYFRAFVFSPIICIPLMSASGPSGNGAKPWARRAT